MGTASTRAKAKYNKANYKQFLISMKPEDFQKLEQAVAEAGVSRNQYITDMIIEKIKEKA